MSNIEQFVAALSLDNMVDAKEAFESALALKISDKFEAKRIELASEVSEYTKKSVDELDEATRGDKEQLDNLKKTQDELMNAKDHKDS